MALRGPRPIETVGNSQKSGISRGWGYDDRPPGPALRPCSSRRKYFELVLAQAALEEGPGVDAGGGVALEVHLVAGLPVGLAAEEVVEADLVQAGASWR